jgi:high frequency lysogenization protein
MGVNTKQALALAGVAQSAFLVNQLAQYGLAAQDKQLTMVNSLFVTNPHSAEEIYGSKAQLKLGLELLSELLSGDTTMFTPNEIMRYLLSLLHLQQKLARDPDMLNTIGTRIDILASHYTTRNADNLGDIISELARLYQETISRLPFRIQVRGDMKFLQNDEVAARIRTMLFAGIRSAVLWRQSGGKRWHLMFSRNRLQQQVRQLLHQI